MKLPDFLQFEPFNRLRERMGADQLGAFEFFDPTLHLTAAEREQLIEGLRLGWAQLRCLHDYTLAYKNSRVLLWIDQASLAEATGGGDVGSGWAAPCYHLADCRSLRAVRRAAPEARVVVGTALPPPDPWPWRVCPDCLQQVQFRGFDAARARHRDYSDRVLEQFDLGDFFRDYPLYPVTTEVLRALDSVV